MKTYTVTLGGRTLDIEAEDPEAASVAAEEYIRSEGAKPVGRGKAPAPPRLPTKSAPAKRTDADVRASPAYAAQRAKAGGVQNVANLATGLVLDRLPVAGKWIAPTRDTKTGLDATRFALPLPVMDEVAGAAQAAGEGIRNVGRGLTGRPMVDLRAAYLAGKDEESAREEDYRKRKPVTALTANLVGGLAPLGPTGLLKLPALVRGAAAAAGAAKAVTPMVRAIGAAKAVGKGAAVGAGYSAAYGAADADGGIVARGKAAARAAPAGAAAGAGLTVAGAAALPVLRTGARLGADLGRGAHELVTAPFRNPDVQRIATPGEIEAAERVVERILADGGVRTPEDLAARLADRFAGDGRATAAEIAGRNGVGFVTAANRRPGASADLWERVIETRQGSNPTRALNQVEDQLGIRPEFARGDIQSKVGAGRRAAEPLYDEAHGVGPLDPTLKTKPELPTLDDLARRPDIQDAIRDAVRLARNEGRDPRELGLVHMDALIDDGLASGAPSFGDEIRRSALPGMQGRVRAPGRGNGPSPLDAVDADLVAAIRRGESSKIREGPTLLQFIAKNGGLHDEGGELAAMDADKWHVGKPYQPKVVKPGGMSDEDEAMLRAWEAGYFPDHIDKPPTRDEFMEVIRDELAGRRVRFSDARYDPVRRDRIAAMEALEERLHRLGVDPRQATDADIHRAMTEQHAWETSEYGASPGPQMEPVAAEQFTARTWDYVKRALDDVIQERHVVHTTGQLKETDKARAAVHNAQLLRDQLRNLNPKYGEALDVSGDYLSLQAAFRDAKGKLMHAPVQDFANFWHGQPGQAQREAIQMAIANDVLEMVEKGQLKNGRFSVPGVREKLMVAFGPQRADGFVRSMEAMSRMNRTGSRMAPGVNSTTAEAQAFAQAQDGEGVKVLEPAIRQLLATGNPFAASGTLVTNGLFKALAYARTTGLSVPVRDEAGRLLAMDAKELKTFIERRAKAKGIPSLTGWTPPKGGAAGAVGGMAAGQPRQ